MSLLKWDQTGERLYETGVSKGVLYVMGENGYGKGVAWNGLTAVNESPEGGELSAVYADNIKYLSLRSAEDFKATIECYTYPDEFAECNGEAAIATGAIIGQQKRKTFAFCYQTKIGSDTDEDKGYKIHIIYGATAAPSERSHETVNDSPEAMSMSFELNTVPVEVEGFKPTAHIVLDSTKVPAAKLTQIKNSLYGVDADPEHSITGSDPTLLLPDDIVAIINANG